ncbi:MAG: hypothetical protein OQJ77_05865 [Thiovulaceae bacterium]|nr:hypothetical protein [Sulfurimonadaceae bacterium]MCW9026825.1 hypothetical protein [Sulfurimonadaceae bacterium]
MKKILFSLLLVVSVMYAKNGYPDQPMIEEYIEEPKQAKRADNNDILMKNSSMLISVVGQGVAPGFASSPAQAFALAKRAAMSDAYRLIAEKIKGVRVEGKDTIKNMAIKSSVVNTKVAAMVKNASVVETTYKEGLCEVEMEIELEYNNF